MKKKIAFPCIIYIFLCSISSFGQMLDSGKLTIIYPLEIPMSVSGTFGELRSNALHAGFDFRTQSKTGFNVHTIDSGYVSRIKIEPGGYGRAVYINHSNGLTSVYAHLEKLYPALDTFVKNEQYRLLQFQVDLFPPKDSLRVKKNDIIGFSGNSGSSTGPHLHFEIREEKTQIPVNFVKMFNFEISDTLPPVIQSLWVYPLDSSSQVNLCDSLPFTYTIKPQDSIIMADSFLSVWGRIGFGIEVFDPVKQNINKTGIYSIVLYVDSLLIFNQLMDQFAFDQVRYVNSMIDYGQFIKNNIRVNRLFVQPNNKLTIYPVAVSNGILTLADTLVHKITIIASDVYGNSRKVSLSVKGEKNPNPSIYKSHKAYNKISCASDQYFEDKNIRLFFGQNSLYEDLPMELNISPQQTGYYSDFYQVHHKYTPIHQAVRLQIKTNNLPDKLKPKALLAGMENNKIIWCGGYAKSNFVEATIRSFGTYVVIIDTVAPAIRPIKNISKNSDFTKEQIIGFTVTDDLSGISNFQGFIDGSWALFEYDAKNNFLYYEFDPTRIAFGTTHKLDLFVSDARGNQNEIHTAFIK
jgi:hypothetical protein